MRTYRQFFAASMLLAIFGCGGSGGTASGPHQDVSGIVQTVDGDVVRGATVYVDNGPQTFSNSSGAYVLENVAPPERTIRARIVQDGVEYYGEQVVSILDDRSKSVNVTVVRSSQRAAIHGRVVDRNGFFIGGARVFAISGALSSTVAITDRNGNFKIDTLLGDQPYLVTASARGFDSDSDNLSVPAGQDTELLFTLSNASNPSLPAPANFSAVAWTSPREATRSTSLHGGIEAVKKLYDPRTPVARTTRDTALGNYIEVDMFWDAVNSNGLLGYGIYRHAGSTGSFTAIDFLRDPLAEIYEDNDPNLHEFQTFTYAVSALNTVYPDSPPNDESALSSPYTVQTLADLLLAPTTGGSPVRFNWQTGSGATSYIVYVFDRYPGIGVSSLANNSGSPTSSLNIDYSALGGPPLQSGHRYYYVVLGLANGGDSRTISRIDDFVAP